MEHDAITGYEYDDASDGNDNHMNIQELDGAFCERSRCPGHGSSKT